MAIKFLQAGLQTSLQDLGRHGYRSLGIGQSGAIDPFSLQVANWLANNPLDNPCLEIYLIGPSLEFTQDTIIGIAGAEFEIFINDIVVERDKTLTLQKGDVLRFGKLISGARAYLAFNGTPKGKSFLQSFSTDISSQLGFNHGQSFKKNDFLGINSSNNKVEVRTQPEQLKMHYSKKMLVRICKGVEYSWLSKESQQNLFFQSFTIDPNSNRMGLRTKSESLELQQSNNMKSSPVTIGTIQLPASGQPIVLLNEGQTIGGYPRIGQVISADLPLLGQLAPNTELSFFMVKTEKAKTIHQLKEQHISKLLD